MKDTGTIKASTGRDNPIKYKPGRASPKMLNFIRP